MSADIARAEPRMVTVGNAAISEIAIVKALEKAKGILSDAAATLGVYRHVLNKAINGSTYLREIRDNFQDIQLDKTRKIVFGQLDSGSFEAAKFVLTTIGKEDGWSTKQELTVKQAPLHGEKTHEELRVQVNQLLREQGVPEEYLLPKLGSEMSAEELDAYNARGRK